MAIDMRWLKIMWYTTDVSVSRPDKNIRPANDDGDQQIHVVMNGFSRQTQAESEQSWPHKIAFFWLLQR